MKKLLFALAALAFAGAAGAAGFTLLDRAAARSLADPQTHRQPTIVALWSSECVHCKKNLRLFAEMAQADKRLRVVTVAAEAESPALAPILDGLKLTGARYAYGDDAPEAIAFALDPTWAGELPRTFLLDGKGGMKKLSGVVDREKAVAALGRR